MIISYYCTSLDDLVYALVKTTQISATYQKSLFFTHVQAFHNFPELFLFLGLTHSLNIAGNLFFNIFMGV